jgi:hypothetical protein
VSTISREHRARCVEDEAALGAGQRIGAAPGCLISFKAPARRSEIRLVKHILGWKPSLDNVRWRHCGRPKAAAFSASVRWSAVGTYSAGISRSVSLN